MTQALTLNEIFVLNRALDGKDIYSLPAFFCLEMDELSVILHKNVLIEKGFLESLSSFTDKGLTATKLLQDFKQAKKYFKINEFTFGIIDNKSAVLLENIDSEYSLVLVSTESVFEQLTTLHGFLSLDYDCSFEEPAKSLSPENFLQNYSLHSKNSFSLTTKTDKESTVEIYFSDGISLYVYDGKKHVLTKMDTKSIGELLSERLAF